MNETRRTDPSDEALRRAWSSPEPDAAPGADCPEPEKIIQAVEGELDPEETREIVDHTSGCASCAEAWRLAAALVEEEQRQEIEVASPPRRTSSGRRYWLAAAAVVIAVVGVVYLQTTIGPGGGTIARGGDTELRSLVEETSLPMDNFLLRWSPGPDGTRYAVEVLTEMLDPVSTSGWIEVAEYQVPVEDLREVSNGEGLLWRVEAELPDGSTVGSGTYLVEVE